MSVRVVIVVDHGHGTVEIDERDDVVGHTDQAVREQIEATSKRAIARAMASVSPLRSE